MTKSRTTPQILRATRKLLSTSDNWTRGTFARDALGMPVDVFSEHAASFCVTGALRRVAKPGERIFGAWLCLRDTCESGKVSNWNDAIGRTHREVVEWLTRALAKSVRESA